jgi:signal transduction histidine kinase
MKQNCYRLLRLINNLIDITKIDSGFINLNLQNKNIVEVIENVTLSTVEYVESKCRTIIFDTDVEEKIMAFDPEKIERIILNLISNAVKFTKPQDQIEINVYDKKENIIISVKDTGIGIPKEKQKIIFERFRQVSPLLNRTHEGSGIGLSLVKSLVEMHTGNKISVKRANMKKELNLS